MKKKPIIISENWEHIFFAQTSVNTFSFIKTKLAGLPYYRKPNQRTQGLQEQKAMLIS